MRVLRSATALLVLAVVAAACGTTAATPQPSAASPSAAAGRPSVLPQIVSSELGTGSNRVVFSFLDASGNRPVAAPDRSASVRFTGPGGATVGPVDGSFVWAIEDEVGVYAVAADFPEAGSWRAEFTTSAPGSAEEVIPFEFDVLPDTNILRPGEKAPAVDTPTVDDVDGELASISTDTEPEPDFYSTSIADAVEAGEPFVVAFATPKFCTSAQCGPTLDRLKPIAEAHPDVTFINVEPYQLELRDGQLQPVLGEGNRLQSVPAAEAFGLLTEPYVFVVDGSGTIGATFELIFGEEEIEAALADLD